MRREVKRPEPHKTPAGNKPCDASLEVHLGIQEVRCLRSMAATIPEPINKAPATADSKDTTGAPPVLGNTVVSMPESSVALTVAVGVAVGQY